jgi:chitinase
MASKAATTTEPAAWSATAVYTAGMEVSEDGVIYVANWWTQGNDPATNNGILGTGQPWTIVTANGVPVPAAPAGLAVTAATSSTITLSWKAVTPPTGGTITGYTIFENGKAIGTTSSTSFQVTGLAAAMGYTFTVEAADSAGLSKPSAAVVGTTTSGAAVAVPAAPTGLAAGTPTSSSVTLSWKAVTPPANATITGYTVLENGTAIGTTTGTSFAVTGLAAGTAYSFTVEAADSAGLSKPSTALAVTTAAASAPVAVPAAPTGLAAGTPTSSSVTLSWKAVTPPANATITGYTVLENGAAIATTTATSFAVTGLAAATAYSFAVEAADSAGLSKPSAAVGVTTAAASGGSTVPVWSPTAIYTAGMEASVSGIVYDANYWNQDTDPADNYGPSDTGEPWSRVTPGGPATSVLPTVPTGLAAIGTTSTTTALTWQPATVPDGSVSGYAVYENGTQIATTTAAYDQVTGLTPGATYDFTVAAEAPQGNSAPSGAVAVTTPTAAAGSTPIVFAPYIDMGLSQDDNLVAISQASGIKDFTLAFIQSSGNGTIGWSGTGTITQDTLVNGTTILQQIQNLRAIGGNVIISFGGAAGIDPATVATSAAQLQAEYQSVINRYGVNSLDFDIEGAPETNSASLHLRDEALVGLKAANPGLQISFTVPVLPSGLDSNGLAIMQDAKADGLTPNVVNVMAMDYGANADNGGQMGTDAISAALNTAAQLQFLGLDSKIGITPMIGLNDVSPEDFTLADAQTVANFAAGNSDIARLAYWSVARDNASGIGYVGDSSSGISQTPYQFAGIFEKA